MAFEDFFKGQGALGMGRLAGGVQQNSKPVNSFNPNDPWGWLGQQSAGNFGDIFNVLMSQAGGQGLFDPSGNQALMGALRQDAQRQSLGRTRSAMEFAKRNNLDPSAQGFAGLMAMLGGQSDLASSLQNARLQSGLGAQDFYQKLFGAGLSNHWDWMARDQQYKINQGLAQAKPKSDVGGMFGGLLGTAAGSWLAPGGFWGGSGGSKMQQAPANRPNSAPTPYGGYGGWTPGVGY